VLLYVQVSHWCSSDSAMISLELLKGSGNSQDEVESDILWLCFDFGWIFHAVRSLLEISPVAL